MAVDNYTEVIVVAPVDSALTVDQLHSVASVDYASFVD